MNDVNTRMNATNVRVKKVNNGIKNGKSSYFTNNHTHVHRIFMYGATQRNTVQHTVTHCNTL